MGQFGFFLGASRSLWVVVVLCCIFYLMVVLGGCELI